MSLEAGARLGTYEIIATLGAGGMGEVYRAKDLRLGREVALKVVRHTLLDDPGYLERLEEEARCASVLNHPNIVTIYGVGDHGDSSYIAMELVRGESLRSIIARGPIPVKRVLDIAAQIADAVAAAHEQGIVHRDLKPGNVMLTPDGLIKVLDFGLAKRHAGTLFPADAGGHDATTHMLLTQPGVIVGTIGYMSPEQASGQPVTSASDQFALGVIRYEMLCGRRPFDRQTDVEALIAIARDEHEPVRSISPDVPPDLERVVERCLAKRPSDRYSDTRQLAEDLRRVRDGRPLSRVDAPSPVSRRKAIMVGGAATLAAAAAFAGWKFRPLGAPPRRPIAVLPFVNILGDDTVDYLCDGMTEGLIRQLSRLPQVAVAPRTAVFTFREKKIDPREAGRQLRVEQVLAGSVQRQSQRLLIAAELLDVATGTRVWTQKYDTGPAELLATIDEIAVGMADQGLKLQLTEEERRQLVRTPTTSGDAYELYMRAMYIQRRATEDEYLDARRLLRRAVALDPKFALAYQHLAGTYAMMAVDGLERPNDAWPQVHRHLQQALAIDPDLPDARAISCAEVFFFDWDWERAEFATTTGSLVPESPIRSRGLTCSDPGCATWAAPIRTPDTRSRSG